MCGCWVKLLSQSVIHLFSQLYLVFPFDKDWEMLSLSAATKEGILSTFVFALTDSFSLLRLCLVLFSTFLKTFCYRHFHNEQLFVTDVNFSCRDSRHLRRKQVYCSQAKPSTVKFWGFELFIYSTLLGLDLSIHIRAQRISWLNLKILLWQNLARQAIVQLLSAKTKYGWVGPIRELD